MEGAARASESLQGVCPDGLCCPGYCLVWQGLVTDLVGVRVGIAELGASVNLFWGLRGGHASLRP